jgi:hypothetical protein
MGHLEKLKATAALPGLLDDLRRAFSRVAEQAAEVNAEFEEQFTRCQEFADWAATDPAHVIFLIPKLFSQEEIAMVLAFRDFKAKCREGDTFLWTATRRF